MARTPLLDQRAQEAVRLIANADAGYSQEEIGRLFHVSRDCVARVLSHTPRTAPKEKTDE